jgi:hypothetical protein
MHSNVSSPPFLTLPYSRRQPFSFGGLYGTKSKYGDMDITGDGGKFDITRCIHLFIIEYANDTFSALYVSHGILFQSYQSDKQMASH